MKIALIRMPYDDWLKLVNMGAEDWILEEFWEESEEINTLEREIINRKAELKNLQKALFELKHPKK